jgi:hypothetical protein
MNKFLINCKNPGKPASPATADDHTYEGKGPMTDYHVAPAGQAGIVVRFNGSAHPNSSLAPAWDLDGQLSP